MTFENASLSWKVSFLHAIILVLRGLFNHKSQNNSRRAHCDFIQNRIGCTHWGLKGRFWGPFKKIDRVFLFRISPVRLCDYSSFESVKVMLLKFPVSCEMTPNLIVLTRKQPIARCTQLLCIMFVTLTSIYHLTFSSDS